MGIFANNSPASHLSPSSLFFGPSLLLLSTLWRKQKQQPPTPLDILIAIIRPSTPPTQPFHRCGSRRRSCYCRRKGYTPNRRRHFFVWLDIIYYVSHSSCHELTFSLWHLSHPYSIDLNLISPIVGDGCWIGDGSALCIASSYSGRAVAALVLVALNNEVTLVVGGTGMS